MQSYRSKFLRIKRNTLHTIMIICTIQDTKNTSVPSAQDKTVRKKHNLYRDEVFQQNSKLLENYGTWTVFQSTKGVPDKNSIEEFLNDNIDLGQK